MLTMINLASEISVVLMLLLHATTFQRSVGVGSGNKVAGCNEKDRVTLLMFKQGIVDPSNLLSTWSHEQNCCAWKGVECDKHGRVTKLDLYFDPENNSKALQGDINLSLLELEFLNYLDLSLNDFERIIIPSNDTNRLKNQSLVTQHSFSKLQYLDLSDNDVLHIDNLYWLSRLSSLQYLYLSNIDLHMEVNWLQSIASLPSLSELFLTSCQLTYISPFLKNVENFSSLVSLDLHSNYFHSQLPNWLFNLSTDLSYLDLGDNNFSGQIPDWSSYPSLNWLSLQRNKLNGTIPDWLGQLEHFQHLDLSNNLLHGSIPLNLGNLSSLHTFLDISFNSLSGKVSKIIGEPFKFLGLSHNSLSGDLSKLLLKSKYIYMASNDFKGGLPHISGKVRYLDLADNSFSGTLSPLLCHSTVNAMYTINELQYLNISYNLLTGEIPDCWMNWRIVSAIFLASNRLTGELPPSLGSLIVLQALHLQNNSLFGNVTMLLQNCLGLRFLDLEKNNFSGSIPNTSMVQSLQVIKLRSNQFNGYIPTQLCQLSSLIILDLADNKLSGPIPRCLYNITSMVSGLADDASIRHSICQRGAGGESTYCYKITLNTKGQQLEYLNVVLLRTIDFSDNNLSGEIPSELFSLVQLQNLNLSHNHLMGKIPKKIGDMKYLESLDISNNKLSGEIPQSISSLSFLSYMNISYNNFIGQIPLGTQLQSFDAWSYTGNPMLCGPPLPKNCTKGENLDKSKVNGGNKDDSMTESLYLGMGVGFAVGFWGVCGSLFLNRAWRHTYFRFLYHMADKLYVFVIFKFNRFRQIGAN